MEATGLIVDGTFLGAAKDIVPVKEHLDELLAQYKENDTDRVEFTKSVELEEGLYLQSNIVEAQDLIDKIESKTQVDRYYTTVAGDTPISIAEKNDISLDTLVSLNADILTNCPIGRHVLVTKSERFLSVKRIVNTTYTVEVDYGTTYVETNSLYKGQTQEKSAGVKGERTINADISYVDGTEVGREILSSEVTKQPVDRVVLKGTAAMPSTSAGRQSVTVRFNLADQRIGTLCFFRMGLRPESSCDRHLLLWRRIRKNNCGGACRNSNLFRLEIRLWVGCVY